MEKIRVFVSYSWDDAQHRGWVKQLADTLEEIEELHVTWDGYDLNSLVDKNLFMEEGVHNADFVLVVATAKYKHKADARLGGVGLETYLSSAVHWDGLLQNNRSKVVVLLRETDSTPRYLQGHFYLDFRKEDEYPARIEELLKLLSGTAVAERPKKRRSIATPLHVAGDDPVIAFIKHRRSQLLSEGLRPVLRDDGTRHEHFVNLELRVPRDQDPAGHDPERSKFDQLRDLLESQTGVWAWVLLGDPGGGKSTLLFMEELLCAEACLNPTVETTELCIRLPLSDFNAQSTLGPDEWIDEQIRAQCPPGLAPVPSLRSLEAKFSVRLLLDGLNEIAGTDLERNAAQATLIKWALARCGQKRGPAPIFTVRRLDYFPVNLGDRAYRLALADIRPWSSTQIRLYCNRHALGLWSLVDDSPHRAEMLELLSNPFNLRLQEWLFLRGDSLLSANRGELLGQVGRLRLRDETRKGGNPALDNDRLMPKADRNRIELSEPSDALHNLPLQGELLSDLTELSLSLHLRDANVWALFTPGYHDPRYAVDARFNACIAIASALTIVVRRQGHFSFQHHLWQEYFAAMALASRPIGGPWPPFEPPEQDELDEQAWELPAARAIHLDACVQLAVQIARNAATLVSHLSIVNPPLASRSLRGLGERSEPLALERNALRQKLLDKCGDRAVPLPERVEAGEELGILGDTLRFEEQRGATGARYLLPRQSWMTSGRVATGWVPVPPGVQRVGEDPLIEVEIGSGLEIAFAPLTNAEFSCFVEARGYGGVEDEKPPPWWSGDASIAWWRGATEDLGYRRFLTTARKEWIAGGTVDREAFRHRWFPASKPEEVYALFELPDVLWDAELAQRIAGRKFREPAWWNQARFANPLQPVVGISAFEADAYCRWLSLQAGASFLLPAEAEWEITVTQGQTERTWPWGAESPDKYDRLNHAATRLRRTAPIGCFPAGSTVEGLTDCAGQVWEWMRNDRGDSASEGLGNLIQSAGIDPHVARSVRGGSWAARDIRSLPRYRGDNYPGYRNYFMGMRLMRRQRGVS